MLAFTRNWNFQRGKELREIESSYFLGATGSCTVTAGIRGQHNWAGRAASMTRCEQTQTNKNKQTNRTCTGLTSPLMSYTCAVESSLSSGYTVSVRGNPPREKFSGNPSNRDFRLYQRTEEVHNNENNRSFERRYKKSHTLQSNSFHHKYCVCICIYL